jgi:hypothetical protein
MNTKTRRQEAVAAPDEVVSLSNAAQKRIAAARARYAAAEQRLTDAIERHMARSPQDWMNRKY